MSDGKAALRDLVNCGISECGLVHARDAALARAYLARLEAVPIAYWKWHKAQLTAMNTSSHELAEIEEVAATELYQAVRALLAEREGGDSE